MIESTENDKIYIGSTSDFKERLKIHFQRLKKGNHPNSNLQEDFNKFDEYTFNSYIIELCDNYLEREQWYINFFKPDYNVNKDIEIKVSDKEIEKFKTKMIKKENGCWTHDGHEKEHYKTIRIGKIKYGAHRLSYFIYNGPFPNYLRVLHKCNNKYCVNPDHLYLGTDSENKIDAVNNGLGCKVNMEIARFIRSIYSKECTSGKIPEVIKTKFGIEISSRNVCSILSNETFYEERE